MRNILIFISIIIPYCLFSQDNGGNNKTEKSATEAAEETINSSFSVPSIPALEFLSYDPENISRPSSPRELGASLFSGIDAAGKVKQGLAIEAKLSKIIESKVDLRDYQKKPIKYILYNAQISLGSVATSGDSSNTDIGWGFRLTLFDNSDPMRDSSFTNKAAEIVGVTSPGTPPMEKEIHDEMLKKNAKDLDSIRINYAKNHWNASWLVISYAGGSRLAGSEITQGKPVGQQFLVAGGLGIGKWGQFGYMVRWLDRIQEDTKIKTQEFSIGGKFLIGRPKYNLFAELAYNHLLNKDEFSEIPSINTDNDFSWSAGVEFFVANGVWAVAGIGQNADRIVGNDSVQLLSGLRMGISDKSRFTK